MACMYIYLARILVFCLKILYILLISIMNFIIGLTFQPLALMSFVRFSYFFVFSCIFFGEYLSLQ
jgi:hypothetical protein